MQLAEDLECGDSPFHMRAAHFLALTIFVAGVVAGCGESSEVLLERAGATNVPCQEADRSTMSPEQYEQVKTVLWRRCNEQRCAVFNEALQATNTASIRAAVAVFRTMPFVPVICEGVTEAEAALATSHQVQSSSEAVPPRWREAWQALKTMPGVPGAPRSTFLSDEAIQQVASGCYEEARREHQSAFAQANWAVAIAAVSLAVECGRARTDGGVTDEQLRALEQRSEDAQLCSGLTNANAATSWAAAISALEGVESATAAPRLSSSERSSVARALRGARSSLAQQERSRERNEQRCDYANQRADRCNEICDTRDRGGSWYDRCIDMCDRRYPGCEGSGDARSGSDPVLRPLSIAICDSDSAVEVIERGARPAARAPRTSRRRQNTEQLEVSVDDFE